MVGVLQKGQRRDRERWMVTRRIGMLAFLVGVKGGFEGVLEGQLGVGRWVESWICRLGGMEGIPELHFG